jgi:hypothetical protein
MQVVVAEVATCVWEASRADAAAVTTQIEDLLKAHAAYMAKEPRPRGVRLAGVLQALKEDVNAGWLKTVEELAVELMVMVDTPGLQQGRRPRDRAAAGQDGQATPGGPALR